MKNCYRIVTDKYNGFEVQIKKRFLFWPYWVQCNQYGEPGTNTLADLDKAKKLIEYIEKHKKFKSEIVWVSENCK